MSFNPKIVKFIDENEDLTILGLYWAMTWRFMIVYLGICVFIVGLSSLIN